MHRFGYECMETVNVHARVYFRSLFNWSRVAGDCENFVGFGFPVFVSVCAFDCISVHTYTHHTHTLYLSLLTHSFAHAPSKPICIRIIFHLHKSERIFTYRLRWHLLSFCITRVCKAVELGWIRSFCRKGPVSLLGHLKKTKIFY